MMVLVIRRAHRAAVAGGDVSAAAIPVANVHAAPLARDAVEVEGADQARRVETPHDIPLHGARPDWGAYHERVVAEVDAAIRKADEVDIKGRAGGSGHDSKGCCACGNGHRESQFHAIPPAFLEL